MSEHVQGQPGADRAVGRPGPAVTMAGPPPERPRPSVLIAPVTPNGVQQPVAPASEPLSLRAVQAPNPTVAAQPVPGPPPQAYAGAAAATAASAPAPAAPVAAGPGGSPYGPAAGTAPTARPATTRAAKLARTAVRPSGGPRSARVYLTHIDPWSVSKQAFLLALAIAIIILMASATLWFVLDSAGVLDAITRTATDVGGESGASVSGFLSFGKVMGVALVVAGIQTVLVTALCTLFAFMYNLAVGIGGGLEVTLSEED